MKTEKRIIMAKSVARRYLEGCLNVEYRFKVFGGRQEIRNLPNLLRSFRDGKITLVGLEIDPITDLGIKEDFDSLTLWSSKRESLKSLTAWFEKKGLETTGIW